MKTQQSTNPTTNSTTDVSSAAPAASQRSTGAVDAALARAGALVEKARRPSAVQTATLLLFLGSIAAVHSSAFRSLASSPFVLAAVAVSLVPAALTAAYVRESHPDDDTPFAAATAVAVLGAAAVAPAYLLNENALPFFEALPAAGFVVFLAVFVGPVEESLKMAALHLLPGDGWSPMDGAVLGAFTGLGFAFGENTLYLVSHGLLGPSGLLEVFVGRMAVAPLHVLWSAAAGYYLFRAVSSDGTGLRVLKTVVAVGLLHGGYNAGVSTVPAAAGSGLGAQAGFLVFAVVAYGATWFAVERVIRRERRQATADDDNSVDASPGASVQVEVA